MANDKATVNHSYEDWYKVLMGYERSYKRWEARVDRIVKKYKDDSRYDRNPKLRIERCLLIVSPRGWQPLIRSFCLHFLMFLLDTKNVNLGISLYLNRISGFRLKSSLYIQIGISDALLSI